MAMLLTFYGKTRRLSHEDVELLCGQLPVTDVLRMDLKRALGTLPPRNGDGPGVGFVLYPFDYGSVIEAIRSARRTGVRISADLAELQTDLETAQDPAAAPPGGATDILAPGGDGYQVEPPTIRD